MQLKTKYNHTGFIQEITDIKQNTIFYTNMKNHYWRTTHSNKEIPLARNWTKNTWCTVHTLKTLH